jgi:hypothetical protein
MLTLLLIVINAVIRAQPDFIVNEIVISIWVLLLPWSGASLIFVVGYLLPIHLLVKKTNHHDKWWGPVLAGIIPAVLSVFIHKEVLAVLLLSTIGVLIASTFWFINKRLS